MIPLEDIKKAHNNISSYIYKTPQIYSKALSTDSQKVYLKLESMQITGSFKLRGAMNKLLSLSEEQKKRGVIAVSTGNHGKGVAYAAKLLGIKSKIYLIWGNYLYVLIWGGPIFMLNVLNFLK